jgi:hypothetical protein
MAKLEEAMKAVDAINFEVKASQSKLDYNKAENERLTRLNASLKDQIDATLATARQEADLERRAVRDEYKKLHEEKEKLSSDRKSLQESLGILRVEQNNFGKLKDDALAIKVNAEQTLSKCAEFIRVVREMAVKL